jgi:amidophosphoribosyltransferase
MCGIIGLLLANQEEHVNQLLFDGLTVLQHRGQDAAGMVTIDQRDRLRLRKDNGLVRDVFQQEHMLELKGHIGIGHVRYPTAGSSSQEEAQPFMTNYPLGVCVAHNGNLTNTDDLQSSLKYSNFRHVNTDSDSEVLLNVFAESLTNELVKAKTTATPSTTSCSSMSSSASSMSSTSSSTMMTTTTTTPFRMQEVVFSAMETVMTSCQGGYGGVYLINGFGLVGFRDPHGIRPLVFGIRNSSNSRDEKASTTSTTTISALPESPRSIDADNGLDFCIASESVVLDTLGFKLVRYVPNCVFTLGLDCVVPTFLTFSFCFPFPTTTLQRCSSW